MKMNLPCTYFVIFLQILITNGGNTKKRVCDRNFSDTEEVEYVCPPYPNDTRTIIHVKSTQRLLTIDCNHTEVLDDTVLPRENHSNIVKLKLVRCPFPPNGFRDIAVRFNITTLKELTFNLANTTNYTLKEKELTGLVDLRSMDLSDSNIFSLNGTIFRNTPNLSVLALNGNRIKLNEDLLNNLPNLIDFSMNSNNISYIPRNTFNRLSKLKLLELWNNKIRHLESGVFDGLVNLTVLDLLKNEIHTIEQDAFKDLTNLVYIDLRRNKLKKISRKIFENCTNIKGIWIDGNPGVILIDDVFSQFGKLEKLNLGHNLLENISESIFNGSSNLRVIRLNHNKLINLEKNLFNGLQNLEELNLTNNEIEYLHPDIFSSLRNLKQLYLQHNQIKRIDERLLRNMENLVEINLSYNKITSLHPDILNDKKQLKEFYMSNNEFDFESKIFFKVDSTPNLKDVDLSYNKISSYPDVLSEILTMESINLHHNSIRTFQLVSLLSKKLSGDLRINLDSNNINVIEVDPNDPTMRRKSKTTITITNNPILCDCQASNLARFLQEDESLNNNIWLEPNEVRCSGLMEGKILNKINLADLTCRLDEKCTKNDVCDCFNRSFDDSLIVNCSKRELTDIPELIPSELSKYNQIIVHLEGNRLRRSPGEYDGYKNITELYLQQNEIENVTWIPAYLKVLNMSGNALSFISLEVLKHLNESTIGNLSLGSNPWECDCRASKFAEYLRGHIKQIDTSDIRCRNTDKKLVNLNNKDLCPTNIELTLTLALPILIFLLLLTIATTLYFKFKREILIWLSHRGLCPCLSQEDELDKDKLYDAFISYSHKDEDFVTEHIISVLESGEQPYKLCVHVRDFIPGELIHSQIMNSIRDSRRTIVVLSSSFLESVWGKLEFKTAHTEAMEEGRTRVIIIVYGDVDLKNLDDDLKAYIKTKTYVEWGDPWFWKKLTDALPKRSKKKAITSQKHANMMQFIDDKFHLKRESNSNPLSTPPIILDTSKIEERTFTCIA